MFIQTLLSDPVRFLRIVVIVVLSISLHELAHGFAALNQGDETPKKAGHLTLNPLTHMGVESMIFLCFAGIAWGQMPVTPAKFRSARWGNILVSAAGPFCNLALSGLSIVLLAIAVHSKAMSPEFFYLAAHVNLMLFFINLLPVPPLDGFHVFSEFFPLFKLLENNVFGLFTLMLLFTLPDFTKGLAIVTDQIIQAIAGVSLTAF